MIIYKILVLCIVLFITIQTSMAIPSEEWSKTYYIDDKSTIVNSVIQVQEGYIIVGSRDNVGFIMKTDKKGGIQWKKIVDSSLSLNSVIPAIDGGYISIGADSEGWVSTLVKIDTHGNIQWDKGSQTDCDAGVPMERDSANHIQRTNDGGYIFVGNADRGYVGCAKLVKIDINGDEEWSKVFGSSPYDNAKYVQQTSDGGYIFAGGTSLCTDDPYDCEENRNVWIVKTDGYGNEQWSQTFGGENDDTGGSIVKTKDGGYIVAGYTKSYGVGYYDALLIKTDSYGNEQWSKTFGGSKNDIAKFVQQTSDGGYIFVGGTRSYGVGGSDIWLVKTDSYGNKQWSKTFGGADDDSVNSIQHTSDGGYIIAGVKGNKGWLIKIGEQNLKIISPNGGENWKRGTTKTIKWTKTDNTGTKVKIELLKGGKVNRVISYSTSNTGYYNWKIPTVQKVGTDYNIRIMSTSNSQYKDTSDNNFKIS